MIWLLGLLIVLYVIYIKTNHTCKLAANLPGDLPLPLLGNVHQIGLNPLDVLNNFIRLSKKYNYDLFRLFVGPNLLVFISHPDDIKVFLSDENNTHKLAEYDFLKPLLGEDLLTTTGERSKAVRKILAQTFHYKMLQQFIHNFDRESDKMIEKLKKVANGQVVDVYPYVTLCTLDIISETAMGVTINAQENSESDVVKAIYTFSAIFLERTFSSWKRFDTLFKLSSTYRNQKKAVKIMRDFSHDIIMKRKAMLQNHLDKENEMQVNENNNDSDVGERKKMAFLDMLLTARIDGKPLTDREILDEVCTFLFAGHDTTASAISFAIYELANNPEIQERVYAEQKLLLGTDKSRRVKFNEYQDMKYLDLFIKESLRLHPGIPVVGRLIEKDFNCNGRILPAGTGVIPFIYGINHNPRIYSNPEKCDPDRFLLENRLNNHAYDYIPFSAGPRNCIGQKLALLEIKSVLSKVVRNFKLTTAGLQNSPAECVLITLKSSNGIKVCLTPRAD